MNKQELNRALSHIHASGDLKKEVLMMKSKPAIDVWKMTHRVAVCSLLLVALVLAMAEYNAKPYFVISVYANETDSIELNRKGSTIFVPANDSSNAPSKKDDPSYRPEFDSTLGSEGTMEQMFYLSIYLNDETKNYDYLNVFVDGQLLGPNSKEGFVGYKFKNGEVGRFVRLDVNKNTRLDIVFCDENGKELQHYGMRIEPVEGGWNVTLDEAYVSVWRSGLFDGFR